MTLYYFTKKQRIFHFIIICLVSFIIIKAFSYAHFGIKKSIEVVTWQAVLIDYTAQFIYCIIFVSISICLCHLCLKLFFKKFSFGNLLAFNLILLTAINMLAVLAREIFKYFYEMTDNHIFDVKGIYGYSMVAVLVSAYYAGGIVMGNLRSLHKEKRKIERELIEKQARLLQSQLHSLREQINPHFLFNCLSTLSELIHIDPEQADKFTTSLADTYRYILKNSEIDLVPVSEEIRHVKNYLTLIKLRHNNHIFCDVEPACLSNNLAILPFTLQPLVENAIKHNGRSSEKPLFIYFSINGNFLTVKNNIIPQNLQSVSTGIGLSNIKKRYSLCGYSPLKVTESADEFSVSIPLISLQ